MKSFRFLDLIMVAFVAVLLCSNLIGPAKVVSLDAPLFGTVSFTAAVLFFPISYVFGDILTEVYGYGRTRRVIWTGFAAIIFAAAMAALTMALPPAADWPHQAAYETVFGSTWRIVAASIVAYLAGEFVNSFVMAKMKIWSGGRNLWQRTISSTILGQAVDTALFFTVAFYGSGMIPDALLVSIAMTEFVIKIAIEALLTPVTYAVVGSLKRAEQIDHFDRDTNFSPFAVR
jgi:queuosine precursor transporter